MPPFLEEGALGIVAVVEDPKGAADGRTTHRVRDPPRICRVLDPADHVVHRVVDVLVDAGHPAFGHADLNGVVVEQQPAHGIQEGDRADDDQPLGSFSLAQALQVLEIRSHGGTA
jgi:hypothetical protein